MSERIDPIGGRSLPGPAAPVRAVLLTPAEREEERRRREEQRGRRKRRATSPGGDPPRLDVRG